MKRLNLFCLVILFTQAAFAGELTGFLKDAYEQEKPISGQPVRLRIFKGRMENSGAEAFTDSKGRYVFKNLDQDQAYSYIVTADYMGVPYFKGPFQFSPSVSKISVEPTFIYPVTIRLKDIFLNESVYVEVGRSDMMKIHHSINIQNRGKEAYTPMAPMSELISIPLAKGGFNVEFVDGLQSLFEVDEKKSALIFRAPIYPTKDAGYQVRFTYSLPYSSKQVSLDFGSKAVKSAFNLFINKPQMKVVAQGLQRGPDLPYQGVMSQTYSGGPLAPSDQFLIELKGLPRSKDAYEFGLISGLAAVLLLGAFFFFRKETAQPTDRELLVQRAIDSLVKIENDFAEKKCNESDRTYETERLREYIFELKRTKT